MLHYTAWANILIDIRLANKSRLTSIVLLVLRIRVSTGTQYSVSMTRVPVDVGLTWYLSAWRLSH